MRIELCICYTNFHLISLQGTGLECTTATHDRVSDRTDRDGSESQSDGHNTESQPDLGNAAGSFQLSITIVSFSKYLVHLHVLVNVDDNAGNNGSTIIHGC